MMDDDEIDLVDTFFFPEDGEADPKPIAARLVREVDAFQHLKMGDAAILFLMRTGPLRKAGKMVIGQAALPKFGGAMGKVGTWLLAKVCGGVLPDFVLIFDASYWQQASALQREALCYHELRHCAHKTGPDGEPVFTADGDPVWDIVGHDIEEFNDVAARYGAWSPDIAAFVAAAKDGGVA